MFEQANFGELISGPWMALKHFLMKLFKRIINYLKLF